VSGAERNISGVNKKSCKSPRIGVSFSSSLSILEAETPKKRECQTPEHAYFPLNIFYYLQKKFTIFSLFSFPASREPKQR
jgi:hypothetical protein